MAAVSIDNGTEVPVDLYSAVRQGSALVWTSPPLTSGSHTFKLRVTGTKNLSSGGTWVSVDRVDVTSGGDTTPPALAVTAPTTGPNYFAGAKESVALSGTATDDVGVTQVTWSNNRGGSGTAVGAGNWSISSVPLQDGSNVVTISAKDTAGNSASKTLTVLRDAQAPSVSLTAPLAGAAVSGSAAVTAAAADNVAVAGVQFKLDGVNVGAEDTASPYSITWNTTLTANGDHTLTAVVRDTAGNTATSAPVLVKVLNGVPVTVSIDDKTVGAGLNQMNYTGTWRRCTNCATAGEYGGGNSWSNTLNNTLAVTFNGNQASLYVVKDKYHGIAAVSIDGGPETRVDLYSPTRQGNALVWTSPNLATGNHTFKLRVTSTKNAASGGTWISVDRVNVTSLGTALSAAPTTGFSPEDLEAASVLRRPARKFLSSDNPLVFDNNVREVHVFDPVGEVVYSAQREENASPLIWAGQDEGGAWVESGVYICRVRGFLGDMLYHAIAVVR
jgi:hypothetical protein